MVQSLQVCKGYLINFHTFFPCLVAGMANRAGQGNRLLLRLKRCARSVKRNAKNEVTVPVNPGVCSLLRRRRHPEIKNRYHMTSFFQWEAQAQVKNVFSFKVLSESWKRGITGRNVWCAPTLITVSELETYCTQCGFVHGSKPDSHPGTDNIKVSFKCGAISSGLRGICVCVFQHLRQPRKSGGQSGGKK